MFPYPSVYGGLVVTHSDENHTPPDEPWQMPACCIDSIPGYNERRVRNSNLVREGDNVASESSVGITETDSLVTPVLVEQFPHGLSREWYYDKRMFVLTLRDVSRDAIDTWFQVLKQTMTDWPEKKRWLALHDVSTQPQFILTPYVRALGNEIYNYRRDALRGYIGFVTPRTFVAQMLQIFLATQKNKRYATHLFFTRKSGLEWLKRMADKP